jgi:hypothetical protein
MMWAVIVGLPCYGVAVSAERLSGLSLQVSIRFSRTLGSKRWSKRDSDRRVRAFTNLNIRSPNPTRALLGRRSPDLRRRSRPGTGPGRNEAQPRSLARMASAS